MSQADVQSAEVRTAGAYICIHGCYLFAIGIRPHNGHIPVIRVGGHREEGETGWQCAVREAYEETGLQIQPLLPPTTYLIEWDQLESELQEITWEPETRQEPIPLLVVVYRHENIVHLSLMYLAHAEKHPVPSSETKGLLFLQEEDIHRLCHEMLTLEQYLCRGGKAILSAQFDRNMVLEPFAQLHLLSRMLRTSS